MLVFGHAICCLLCTLSGYWLELFCFIAVLLILHCASPLRVRTKAIENPRRRRIIGISAVSLSEMMRRCCFYSCLVSKHKWSNIIFVVICRIKASLTHHKQKGGIRIRNSRKTRFRCSCFSRMGFPSCPCQASFWNTKINFVQKCYRLHKKNCMSLRRKRATIQPRIRTGLSRWIRIRPFWYTSGYRRTDRLLQQMSIRCLSRV